MIRKKRTTMISGVFVLLMLLGVGLAAPLVSETAALAGDYDHLAIGGSITNTTGLTADKAPFVSSGNADAPIGALNGLNGSKQVFTMNQTLSDQAQENTIAFDALAFLTGDLGSDSFFPPGKVADFWGFQYLRDNDPSDMGHNTDFLTKAAFNMLYVLNDSQRNELIALAKEQVNNINRYALDRFVLMEGFNRLLQGDLPGNSTGLDLNAVMNYSAGLYMLDGQMCLERAQVMGGILHNLTSEKTAYLDDLKGKGMLDWPNVTNPLDMRALGTDVNVAVMTYAGDMFSWYMGSVDADVYFCPERQGTYFGSFYLKDAPAMGNPDYSIGENITSDSGASFLNDLSTSQTKLVTDLVDIQRPYLLSIVQIRTNVSEQLRRYIAGDTPNASAVLKDMERYGEIDGAIVFHYATAFAEVNSSLSTEQRSALVSLRSQLGVTFPQGAFIYSQPVGMPDIPNTDFLFGTSAPSALSDAPIGLTATPGNAEVELTWSAPGTELGISIAGYNIYRSSSSGGVFALVASTSNLTYTDSGLTNGQSYWYKVSAVNASGIGTSSTPINIILQDSTRADNSLLYLGITLVMVIVIAVTILSARRKYRSE